MTIVLAGSLLLAGGCRTEQEVLESEGLDAADGYEPESQSEIMRDQGIEEEAYR